tara:strand:- start:109 stop:312 length:204 start_codon:yes stop_codon:yes gene_type:complete
MTLPDWMQYATTSEIERYTELKSAARVISDAAQERTAPLAREANLIKGLVRKRMQRAKRNQMEGVGI